MDTLIYVMTNSDVNGNPRRGWIVTWLDSMFVDEGYEGRWALYRAMQIDGSSEISKSMRLNFDRNVNEITLAVTVGQYKALKRGAK